MKTRQGKRRKQKVIPNDKYIQKQWEDLRQAGGLSSLKAFAKSRKNAYNLRALEKSLSKIEMYSRYRRIRKKFTRPSIIVNTPYRLYCCDLLQISELARFNKGHNFVLVFLDCFTKAVVLVPMLSKGQDDSVKALEQAFNEIKKGGKNWKSSSKSCGSDGGLEFTNRKVQALFKKYNFTHYVSKTPTKSSMCEAAVKVAKNLLYRYMYVKKTKEWLSVIKIVQHRMNNRIHSAHLFKPHEVNLKNQEEAFSRMYSKLAVQKRKPNKYKKGDKVRIASTRLIFAKHYRPLYSSSVYEVKRVKPGFPVNTYVLQTLEGEELESSFCEEELSLAVLD